MFSQESKYIISIAIIGNDIVQSFCGLVIGSTGFINETAGYKIQLPCLCVRIIVFIVNKDEKVIS